MFFVQFRSEDLIFHVASHLESKGDYFNAIKLYELCGVSLHCHISAE